MAQAGALNMATGLGGLAAMLWLYGVAWHQPLADTIIIRAQFGFAPDRHFNVSSVSLGYIREVARLRGATLGLGAMGTLNMVPSS